MPYYTYRCLKCHKEFECFRYPKNYLDVSCPECSSKNITKLINAVPIHFKGKGFYATDYKDK